MKAKAIGKEWFGGLNVMDMVGALGGLTMATMLPSALVKDATTNNQKIGKVLLAFGGAVAAGFIFRNLSPTAGKYAVAGGVAGALTQTINVLRPGTIGRNSVMLPHSRLGVPIVTPRQVVDNEIIMSST